MPTNRGVLPARAAGVLEKDGGVAPLTGVVAEGPRDTELELNA